LDGEVPKKISRPCFVFRLLGREKKLEGATKSPPGELHNTIFGIGLHFSPEKTFDEIFAPSFPASVTTNSQNIIWSENLKIE
jgi:hypothetical protein